MIRRETDMANYQKNKKYSAVQYWHYVFTPLLLFAVIFGLFLLFHTPDSQTDTYKHMISRSNALIPTGVLNSGSAPSIGLDVILKNIQSLGLRPTSA